MPGREFTPRGPVFSLYALALQEAINGAGVLIGHLPLVADALARGALVAPFSERVTMDHSLVLWSALPLRTGSAAARVAGWLAKA